MRRWIGNVVSVGISLIRLCLIKMINSDVKFYPLERISPNVVIEVSRNARCHFGKIVRIHSGSKIKVRDGAELMIGDNVKVNYNCILICHEKIVIENGVEFGPNVLIYDHDHDFRCKKGIKAGKFCSSPVLIGENSWIGAGTIILRGSTIGKNSVIGAGCIIKGEIPDNAVVTQPREQKIRNYVNDDYSR
jgi:acetyltransferase-like isoleucine patch superfamily enzyme